MSEEQLKAFLEKVRADASLQEKLKAAEDADAVVSIAKEEGFSISVDDTMAQSELSEEELEGVAGGGCLCIWFASVFWAGTGRNSWSCGHVSLCS